MKKDNFNPFDRWALRQRAERQLKKIGLIPDSTASPEELQRLLHEIPVYQIELEMQYEQLQHAYDEIQVLLQRYENLYDFAPVGYLTLTRDSIILDANQTMERVLSCDRSHLIGARFGSFIAQNDLPAFNAMIDKLYKTRSLVYSEITLRNNCYHCDAIISLNRDECHLTLTDISETRHAIDELKKTEAHYKCLFDASQEGILILDYNSGKIVDANPFITQLLGFTLDEILGKKLWEIGVVLDKQLALKAYLELQTKNYICYSDLPLQHKSGKTIEVEFHSYVYNVDDEKMVQCNVRDITLQKQLWDMEKEQKLIIEQLAMHDPLTGLPNRRLLSERILLTIAQCRRNKTMAALMIFDLDNFKVVNDTLGHAIGDILLQQVAKRSVETLQRKGDSITRLGGDEFVVLLHQIDTTSNAVAIAEKIRNKIKEPYTIDGHAIDISCSIGIAVFPDHGDNEMTIMKHADLAMYSAKNQGRDKVIVFETRESSDMQ